MPSRAFTGLKPQRGLRPVVGQSQELPSLLLGANPGGPPKAISRVRVIFVDRGHVPLHSWYRERNRSLSHRTGGGTLCACRLSNSEANRFD